MSIVPVQPAASELGRCRKRLGADADQPSWLRVRTSCFTQLIRLGDDHLGGSAKGSNVARYADLFVLQRLFRLSEFCTITAQN